MTKICAEDGCELHCAFGIIKHIPTHCSNHKTHEMINVITKKCTIENCNKEPSFNFKGQIRMYCSEHKLIGMINVLFRKCIIEECIKEASFNNKGSNSRTHCSEHKKNGMVSSKNTRCLENNCFVRASHNLIDKKPLYCDIHKLDNMVDCRGKRCKEETCDKYPLYNIKGQLPLYCRSHKKTDMIDVKSKKCTNCGLFSVKKANNFLCYYCVPFPRLLKKETKVKMLLEENGLKFTHNKQLDNDCCLKYKPDFLFDCNRYFVVLECDEGEHAQYDQDCEMVRMNNISTGLGLPTLFIRYNPDLPGVKTKQKHRKLIETLNKYLNMDKLEDPTPIYLFYKNRN